MRVERTAAEARQGEINGVGRKALFRSLLVIGVLFVAIAVVGAKTLVSAFSMV